MSSVGVFRKEEIDGNPFLVFTLTHIDNSTSSGEALIKDSGGNDLPLQPRFFCPRARDRFESFRQRKDGGNLFELHPFISSPHFTSTRSGDQLGESLLDYDLYDICKLPVVPLFWCNNKEPDRREFECGVCQTDMLSVSYYACLECDKKFHKECVESPLEIKHPSHPSLSLQLCAPVLFRLGTRKCCTSCGTQLARMSYHCTTCDMSMHPVCAMKPIPFVVDHLKSHPHPLTLFPTQASLVCHFCALIKKLDLTYICVQCVFVIHKDCIGFPHVIRISRHPHRISFTASLPVEKLSCGICHQHVDNNYGAYSCNKCDANFVHSQCALNPKVWDGKELEGIPEEDDMIDDGEPFERIADGIILHPFHGDHLQLQIYRAYDENKYCRGCAIPVYGGQFYSCMKCDFILHESCANAPRMKRHPLYPHPLTLFTMNSGSDQGMIQCSACERDVGGFYYGHYSRERSFKLDLRCASVFEPFGYPGHKHYLFLPWDQHKGTHCQICQEECEDSKLICMECDYTICFRCVTLPYKVRYKHDSHFLTLCDKQEPSDQPDWCEICEGKIAEGTKICKGRIEKEIEIWDCKKQKREKRYYKCDDCCTSLHVECLLGLDMYMKSGQIIKECIASFPGLKVQSSGFRTNMDVQIRLNSSLSRPLCDRCKRRCPFPIYFVGTESFVHGTVLKMRGTEQPASYPVFPLIYNILTFLFVRCDFLFSLRCNVRCNFLLPNIFFSIFVFSCP